MVAMSPPATEVRLFPYAHSIVTVSDLDSSVQDIATDHPECWVDTAIKTSRPTNPSAGHSNFFQRFYSNKWKH